MSRPTPSDDAVLYEAEVTAKFCFAIYADDDIQAEEIASYDWEEYKYLSQIEKIRVDMIEQDEEEEDFGVPSIGDMSDAGMDGA